MIPLFNLDVYYKHILQTRALAKQVESGSLHFKSLLVNLSEWSIFISQVFSDTRHG